MNGNKMIKETTTATFYMIADTVSMQTVNPNSYSSVAMKSCNNCKEVGLKPQWKYCPNCGGKFIND